MSVGQATYEFNAQDGITDEWVALEIAQSDDRCIRYFEKVWHKLTLAVANACDFREHNKTAPGWASWKPHEWNRKAVQDRVKLVAWDGDSLAGFLNLKMGFDSVVDRNPIIYVEHIATFPGNIPTDLWHRRLKRVGVALLAYAVFYAHQNDRRRIGLHADSEAVDWYDELGERFANLFEIRQAGVPGSYPDSQGQLYFETSIEGANLLLESYQNG